MVGVCLRGPSQTETRHCRYSPKSQWQPIPARHHDQARNLVVYVSNAAADSVPARSRSEVCPPFANHGLEAWPEAFRFDAPRPSRTDLLCENRNVESRENSPPSCPPTDVFLVLRLNFNAKISV